jgi:hypothetical protein
MQIPTLNEALVKFSLGRHPLTTWKFVASITDEFILGLDDLGAQNRHAGVLQLENEEMPMRRTEVRPHSSTYMNRSSEMVATS